MSPQLQCADGAPAGCPSGASECLSETDAHAARPAAPGLKVTCSVQSESCGPAAGLTILLVTCRGATSHRGSAPRAEHLSVLQVSLPPGRGCVWPQAPGLPVPRVNGPLCTLTGWAPCGVAFGARLLTAPVALTFLSDTPRRPCLCVENAPPPSSPLFPPVSDASAAPPPNRPPALCPGRSPGPRLRSAPGRPAFPSAVFTRGRDDRGSCKDHGGPAGKRAQCFRGESKQVKDYRGNGKSQSHFCQPEIPA